MNDILVVGSNRYFGSHIYHALKNTYDIDTFSSDHLSTYSYQLMQPYNIEKEYRAVIFDMDSEPEYFSEDNKKADYQEMYEYNVLGLFNLLKSINTKNFIYISSNQANNPDSFYGFTKRTAELLVERFCKDFDMNYTIMRVHALIGQLSAPPNNSFDIMRRLSKSFNTGLFYAYPVKQKSKDGTAARDYVYIVDAVKCVSVRVSRPLNGIEELCHNELTTELELMKIFEETNDIKLDVVVRSRDIPEPFTYEAERCENLPHHSNKKYWLLYKEKVKKRD